MKIYLKRDARIRHKAGEIVEVSPAEAGFLISTGSAERLDAAAAPAAPKVETPEAKIARETPEKPKVPVLEVPEKTQGGKKTARK